MKLHRKNYHNRNRISSKKRPSALTPLPNPPKRLQSNVTSFTLSNNVEPMNESLPSLSESIVDSSRNDGKVVLLDVFSCDKCSFESESIMEFNNHKEHTHNNESYVCEDCDLDFSTELRFNEHISTNHSVEPTLPRFVLFPCKNCDFMLHRSLY